MWVTCMVSLAVEWALVTCYMLHYDVKKLLLREVMIYVESSHVTRKVSRFMKTLHLAPHRIGENMFVYKYQVVGHYSYT